MTKHTKKRLYFMGYHKEWSMVLTDIIARPLAVLVGRYTPITANQISFVSILTIIAGCYFLLQGGYMNVVIGSLLAFAYNVLDMMDGMVAREKKQSSLFGQWIDGVIGFVAFQALIICLAIGLQNYIALILGMIAAISYPTQYSILYYYRAEIMPYQEEMKLNGAMSWIKNVYGLGFFYLFLPIAALLGKPVWVLLFWATFGNLYWIAILFLQYREVRKYKSIQGKPKYKKGEDPGAHRE